MITSCISNIRKDIANKNEYVVSYNDVELDELYCIAFANVNDDIIILSGESKSVAIYGVIRCSINDGDYKIEYADASYEEDCVETTRGLISLKKC